MKLITLALTTFVFTTVIVHAEPEIKGTAAELTEHLKSMPRTVFLTGESDVKVPSDRALISLAVVTEHRSLQESSRANQELRAKMMKALEAQGIPVDRIKASKFSSTPKYGVFGEKAKSYRVENVVKITAHDEKEFQAVANLVDAHSEVRYESIEFEHSDKEGLRKKALSQAIDKVTDKKQSYEEKLGVKLTVKSFSEGPIGSGIALAGRRNYASFDSYGKSAVTFSGGRPAGSSPVAEAVSDELPTSFAEMVFKAQMTLEYTVESK
jgi:uncharacterized protein YggE